METSFTRCSKLCSFLVIGFFLGTSLTQAQAIITNPSFEAPSSSSSVPPPAWTNCSGSPDVQILNGTGIGIYGINTPASHGTTYLGMVTTSGQSWIEALGQPATLAAGTPYSGSIDIFRSNGHSSWSGTGRVQFWGGSSCANQVELLWESNTINNLNNWQTYNFTFTPNQNHTFFKIVNLCNNGSGGGNYFCLDNLSISNILPIELAHFSAQADRGGVDLHWETGSSLEGQFFEVTWSRDGSATAEFETVATVAGDEGQTAYQFRHQDAVAGDNFYRLKSTDENGTVTLSEVRRVALDAVYAMEIFPNPSSGRLSVNAFIEQDGQVNILIHDLSGRLLFQQERQLMAGYQTLNLDLSGQFSSGLYQMSLVESGKRSSQSFSIR